MSTVPHADNNIPTHTYSASPGLYFVIRITCRRFQSPPTVFILSQSVKQGIHPTLPHKTKKLTSRFPLLAHVLCCHNRIGKAAGADKKLFKQLENKYDPTSNANILSPPEDDSIRNIISPFGPMDQPASRKTLFYLIGTLNASFPDYDFS